LPKKKAQKSILSSSVASETEFIQVGADTLQFPVLNFDISLKGQVSKFQNFILALNSIFPTSQLKKVYLLVTKSLKPSDFLKTRYMKRKTKREINENNL